jgi:hypothetical protein
MTSGRGRDAARSRLTCGAGPFGVQAGEELGPDRRETAIAKLWFEGAQPRREFAGVEWGVDVDDAAYRELHRIEHRSDRRAGVSDEDRVLDAGGGDRGVQLLDRDLGPTERADALPFAGHVECERRAAGIDRAQ